MSWRKPCIGPRVHLSGDRVVAWSRGRVVRWSWSSERTETREARYMSARHHHTTISPKVSGRLD